MSTSWISEPNFVRSLKFKVMSQNNQSGKFVYFIGWLFLIVFAQDFFFLFIDWIKITWKLIF